MQKLSQDLSTLLVILLHHRCDSIDKYFEFLDNLLINIQILRPFKCKQSLIVISIFNFDFGDFIDSSGNRPLIGIVFDRLLVAYDGIVGLF